MSLSLCVSGAGGGLGCVAVVVFVCRACSKESIRCISNSRSSFIAALSLAINRRTSSMVILVIFEMGVVVEVTVEFVGEISLRERLGKSVISKLIVLGVLAQALALDLPDDVGAVFIVLQGRATAIEAA